MGDAAMSGVREGWEKAFDIRYKGLLLFVSALLLATLQFDFMLHPLQNLVALAFLAGYCLFVVAARSCTEPRCWRRLWWVGFLLDITFVGYLVGRCGHVSSPFVLLYPLVMLGAALAGPGKRDFLLAGALGHLSYAGGVMAFTGNLGFYGNAEFWAVGGLNGAIFLCATQVVRSLNAHLQEVKALAEDVHLKNLRLEELAVTDGLTGLYNHRYFWERLAQEVERAARYHRPLTLLMLDVDNFKLYNDLHGHLEGDALLCQLAGIIRGQVRQHDVVCRYGGEEFTVILPEAGLEEGMAVAERMRETVAGFAFPGREALPGGKVTVSFGVAAYPQDARETRELVNRADNALYGAKRRGRNRVQAYGSLMASFQDQKASSEAELQEALETLVAIIDGKDSYTGGHSRRVAEYVRQVALRLGMDEQDVNVLTYGAFLHDIGKLEIDRRILTKPGPLSDEERRLIQKHPLFGVNLLRQVMAFESVMPMIKYHHERFDGTGYPEGLQGEAIPLPARIIALADSYDAMRSQRPYRDAMSHEDAFAEIKKHAGRQFDPELAGVFLETVANADEARREAAAGRGEA